MQGNEEFRGTARAPPSALGLGERLRSARKARALSVAQVAESLRLEEATVIALEEGRFDALGAPVFIRGHLRRYAELVGLSTEAVLDAYAAAAPGSNAPPALTRPREATEEVNLRLWALWVILPLLIIGVLAYLIRAGRETGGEGSATTAPASATAEPPAAATVPGDGENPPVPEAAVPTDAATTATESALPAIPPEKEAAPAAAPAEVVHEATPVPPPPGASRLVIRFSEDGWVNVSDADHRLLYGLQRRGSRQELAGKPPFRLMLGNARGVSILVDGKPFPVPADAVADNVARFDIPGSTERTAN